MASAQYRLSGEARFPAQAHDAWAAVGWPRDHAGKLLGAAVHTVPDLAAAASPVTCASPTSAPILLVHGELDDGVPIGQSE